MKNLNAFLCAIACLLLLSCKKEITSSNGNFRSETNAGLSNENAAAAATNTAKWQGMFVSGNGLPPSFLVPDTYFIHDGYARIYSNAFKINKQNYYSTKIWLVIPRGIHIKGDSLNFEAGVKNSFNSTFYPPAHGRDITLYIIGETNEASITNVATSDIDPNALQRATIRLGQTTSNNVSALQYNFQDYGSLILQTFNFGVVAYRNDTYLKGLGYGKEPLIGKLKEIGVVFNGSGFIDYIRIYNSVNGKLLMSEDFDKDGQSNVVWH